MIYKYKHVICAGTFDGLHEGHKQFLRFAFSMGEKVYVTITSDVYTARHKPQATSFILREKALETFLKQENLFERAIIVLIDDVYGIAIDKDVAIDALVVTEESVKGAEMVNNKRQELGLSSLEIIIAPVATGETGLRISSTHLRSGVINERGEIDIKKEFMETTFLLPVALREKLQKPFGAIVSPEDLQQIDPLQLIAVGDVTTRVLHEAKMYPVLSLIDFVIEREKQESSLADLGFLGSEIVLSASNPPGTLTPSLWESLEKALPLLQQKKTTVIIVNGEEDLAVLPLLLIVPSGFTICYGQPHIGMVAIPVNQDTKEQAVALLSSFEAKTTRGH